MLLCDIVVFILDCTTCVCFGVDVCFHSRSDFTYALLVMLSLESFSPIIPHTCTVHFNGLKIKSSVFVLNDLSCDYWWDWREILAHIISWQSRWMFSVTRVGVLLQMKHFPPHFWLEWITGTGGYVSTLMMAITAEWLLPFRWLICDLWPRSRLNQPNYTNS